MLWCTVEGECRNGAHQLLSLESNPSTSPTSLADTLRLVNAFPSHKKFSNSCFCVGLWGKPFKSHSRFTVDFGVSGCKSVDFQSQIHVLGAHLSGAGLKSQGALCGVQTLCSSGGSSGFVSSFLTVGSCAGREVYAQTVSQLLLSTLI